MPLYDRDVEAQWYLAILQREKRLLDFQVCGPTLSGSQPTFTGLDARRRKTGLYAATAIQTAVHTQPLDPIPRKLLPNLNPTRFPPPSLRC